MCDSVDDALKELVVNSDYVLIVICTKDNEFLLKLKLLRISTSSPIVVITDDYNSQDMISAIELGADEYILRPNTIEESIIACIALIRRHTEYCHQAKWCSTKFASNDIFMCLEYHKVYIRGQEIHLTRIEFDLLYTLISNPRKVLTYEILYDKVWGASYMGNANETLWNHIKRIRNKMKINNDIPEHIVNVRDIGCRFDP